MKKIKSALFALLTLTIGLLSTSGNSQVAGANEFLEQGIADLSPVKNGYYFGLDQKIELGDSIDIELRAKGFNTSLGYTSFNIEILIPQDPFETITNDNITPIFSIYSIDNPSGALQAFTQVIPMANNKKLVSITYTPLMFADDEYGAMISNNELLAKIALTVKKDYNGNIGNTIPVQLKSFEYFVGTQYYETHYPTIQSTSIKINREVKDKIQLASYNFYTLFTSTFDEKYNVIYDRTPIASDVITDKKVYLRVGSDTIMSVVEALKNDPAKLKFINTVTSYETGLISESIIEPSNWADEGVGSNTRIELYNDNNRLVDTVYCVVKGDLNGHNRSETSLDAFSHHFSGDKKLKDTYFLAADINEDLIINYYDNYLLNLDYTEERLDIWDFPYEKAPYQPTVSSVKMLKGDYGFDPQYYTTEMTKSFQSADLSIETNRLRAGFIEKEYVVLSPRSTKAGVAYMEYKFSRPVTQINIDLTFWTSNEKLYETESAALIQYKERSYTPWNTKLDILNDIQLATDRTLPTTYNLIFGEPISEFRIYMTAAQIGSSNTGRLCIGDMQIFHVIEQEMPGWF